MNTFQKIKNKVRSILDYRRYPLILVYSMGKVGSLTVFETLKKFFPPQNVHHLHFLSDYWLKEVLPKTNHTHNINHGLMIRGLIQKARQENRPIKIISLVREPVSREVSNFFQNNVDFFEGNFSDFKKEELLDTFKKKISFDYLLNWFDSEFFSYTNIDVYSHEFDKNNGFSIINENGFEVLIIRLENLDQCFSLAFQVFLKKNISALRIANQSKDKSESVEISRFFKKHFKLNPRDLNEIYSSKFMKHFYTSEEISQFRQKWQTKNIQ
jgi:hypothetical protein